MVKSCITGRIYIAPEENDINLQIVVKTKIAFPLSPEISFDVRTYQQAAATEPVSKQIDIDEQLH